MLLRLRHLHRAWVVAAVTLGALVAAALLMAVVVATMLTERPADRGLLPYGADPDMDADPRGLRPRVPPERQTAAVAACRC